MPSTTPDYRYQITCSYCGLIGTEKSKEEAFETAKRLKERHNTEDEEIEVFDLMAQRGTCELWTIDGQCKRRKGYEHSPQTKKEYCVKITKRGASSFSEGSLIRWEEFKEDDRRVRERGEEPASVEIVKEPHPGNGNGGKELPATVQGEPIPDKYRTLIPLIDEPLPPGSDYLVPAIVPEEGERKIDAVLRQLKEGVEGIQNSEQFRLFLTTMAKFHEYSLGNQILIAMQKPEATRVAGFQTWKNLGRFVKKGESGIAILAPIMPPRQKKEEEEDEERPLSPVYFKVVHVFDVSQTEGQPLPEFEVPSLTGEANEELFTKTLALAKAQGLEVSFDPMPSQDPALKGFYSGKKIWVKPDETRAQQLKTLLHEMAHYYSEGVFRIPRRDAETIAESAAFAVGAHFGFDSGVRSFPYVALWAKDYKVLKTNLAGIKKVATVMLEGLEKPEQKLMAQTRKVGYAIGAKRLIRGKGTEYVRVSRIWDQKFIAEASLEGWARKHPAEEYKVIEVPILQEDEKFVPALQPYEPRHFAEFVLRYNRFNDAEIPIYSGLAGKSPLRVPDHIWREVIAETDGEFIKQGEINVFHIPEKERPSYMYAPPFGGFGKAVIPESVSPDIADIITTKLSKISEKYGLPADRSAERTKAQSDLLVRLTLKAEAGAKEVSPALSDTIWDVWKYLYNLMNDDEIEQYKKGKKERPVGMLATIPTEPCYPNCREEQEFIYDSPELIPFTIDDIGYRDKLDDAFEMAIARVQGG